MTFDVVQVDRQRLPELLFAGVRQRDVQTPPIAWAGESLDQPGLDHAVDEPRQSALAEQECGRELAHCEALARCHPQLSKCVEPGEWQPTGRFELPTEDVFQRLVRREERAPGIQPWEGQESTTELRNLRILRARPQGGFAGWPGRLFPADYLHRANLNH